MAKTERQLIWQGRLHLGDEPGFFGDAAYSGLRVVFPVELLAFDDPVSSPSKFLIEVEKVHALHANYSAVLRSHVAVGEAGTHWRANDVAVAHLRDTKQDTLDLLVGAPTRYMTLSFGVDETCAPGLYDELIIRRIWLESTSHYGYLGFRKPG